MAFCAKCGAQLNAGSGFCAACGTPVGAAAAPGAAVPVSAPAGTSTGLTNNVAGMLCYILGIITGIIFLVMDPYKNNRFVRFHAFQSIFFWVACFGFWMIWSFVFVSMLFTPGLGMWGLISLVSLLIRFA
ncbi:MAG TPA: zinc-ribbon domain-containing protein, partial [Candidatus Angelobacter sp.]|nr:zinc-ribbon domain-containing protein [Candidatus Angelobacter sp.]